MLKQRLGLGGIHREHRQADGQLLLWIGKRFGIDLSGLEQRIDPTTKRL